uniref:Keratin n=1 Tax=Terrapene triunguis TaxID=2587831 RepID=A0A674JHU4_9SAUR
MSCNNECYTPGALPGPRPVTHSNNEPCVRQCPDSVAVIQPSPVAVTLPGPILSSFPQQTVVESLGPAGIGGLLGSGGSYGYGGSLGYGGYLNYGGSCGSSRLCNHGGSYSSGLSSLGSGYCSPYSYRGFNGYHGGSCGPC